MNKIFLHSILIWLTLALSLQAQQNLVYNGDFELYSDCPNGCSDELQNPPEITKCLGWRMPTFGSSDFFHVCSTHPCSAVPNNYLGYQYPYSGDGYVGAFFSNFTGGAGWDGYDGVMWWEYLQGQLTQPLEAGKVYRLSMQISVADEETDLAIKEFGAYFSDTPITSLNTANLNVTPQCVFYNENYFKDTINWVTVEANFMAQGGEKYITIGNFKDNTQTDTLRIYFPEPPNTVMLFKTYMYIDDVQLVEQDEFLFSNVFTPNGDGINDYWICLSGDIEEEVDIYNRWGNLIIKSKAQNFQWNGTTREGKNCSEGIYFFVLSKSKKTGFIHLMR